MIAKLQSNQINEQIKKTFAKIDEDKSGVIELGELKKAMEQTEASEVSTIDMAQLKSIVSEIDVNDNHQIEYTEFLAATLSEDIFQNEQVLRGVFNMFDVDKNGSIDKEELVTVFSKFGKQITNKEIQLILEKHDPHQSGEIDFQHFKIMILDDEGQDHHHCH